MTVRFYVTSAALMIFSWLATTFLRDVPMDSYPRPPVVVAVPGDDSAVDEALPAVYSPTGKPPVRFISTATQ